MTGRAELRRPLRTLRAGAASLGAEMRWAAKRLIVPAAATAAVVGSLLTVVNQWDVLVDAKAPARHALLQLAANYAVPLLVSLYSRWSALWRKTEQSNRVSTSEQVP
jgi:hypothetical protein